MSKSDARKGEQDVVGRRIEREEQQRKEIQRFFDRLANAHANRRDKAARMRLTLAGSAFGYGFRDALMAKPHRPPFKTTTNEDYTLGFHYGLRILVEASE